MAQTEAFLNYNSFIAGLITEANPLTFPENASKDLLDVVLSPNRGALKRLAATFESSASFSTATFDNTLVGTDLAIYAGTWRNAGESSNTSFHVIQIGTMLYFNLAGVASPSTQERSFSLDMSPYLAPAFTTSADERVHFSSGKGRLFVTSRKQEPFYIEYNADTDLISATQITLQIRDFEGVDDGLGLQEKPVSLTDEHEYNLYNQGWTHPNAPTTPEETYVDAYFAANSVYPSNVQQWYIGKDPSSISTLKTGEIDTFQWGNTPAPKGHYILEAFNKDRTTVSGIPNLAVVTESDRPRASAFHAGRIWFVGNNGNVYFSQAILDDFSNVGFCYQQEDPTAEELNALLATDGGVLPIPDAGILRGLVSIGNSMIVFAENGVWQISSIDAGFKATDISIDKIGEVGTTSTYSIVKAEDSVLWWSEEGIYALARDQVSGRFIPQSLTTDTIQTFYNAIPDSFKRDAVGVYDRPSKTIKWLYKDGSDGFNRFTYLNVLNLDLRIGSFYPWKINNELSSTPYIFSIVDNIDTVANGRDGFTTLKYVTAVPDGVNSTYTFSDFADKSFTDWGEVSYKGMIFTGYELLNASMQRKQATEVFTYMKRTENEVVDNGDGTFQLNDESSLFLSAAFSWTDAAGLETSKKEQAYRRRRNIQVDENNSVFDDGHPVVVAKHTLKGSGLAVQFLFEGEEGKDFILHGFSVNYLVNTRS